MTAETDIKTLIRKGTALLSRGKHQQALDPLLEAFALDPSDYDATLNLSAAYIMNKQFDKSIPLLESLLKETEDDPNLWMNLGAAYLGNPVLAEERDQLKAVMAFTNALKLDPKTPHAAYNIALIHKDRKELETASQWFNIALATNPSDQDAQYWLDQIAEKGDTEDLRDSP